MSVKTAESKSAGTNAMSSSANFRSTDWMAGGSVAVGSGVGEGVSMGPGVGVGVGVGMAVGVRVTIGVRVGVAVEVASTAVPSQPSEVIRRVKAASHSPR